MKAAYARIADAPDEETIEEVASDRRREPRVPARFQAILQFSEGDRSEVGLADISSHGCCVRSDSEDLRIGRFVAIGIDDGEMLQAVIRWVRDGAAGMEFLRPIPPERSEWHELMEMTY
ncbi:MAG: PilZ domain-containing protein [Novosphingobium sp.]|nr:PilZ domain-containing protein [Novosphingobium sp.]